LFLTLKLFYMKALFIIYFTAFVQIIFAQNLPPHITDAKRGFTWNSGYASYANDIRWGRTEGYLPSFTMQRFDARVDLDLSCAAISDTAGHLLFYTNGIFIGDKNKNKMMNSDTLNPGYWNNYSNYGNPNFKGVLILPMPNHDSLYYVFHNRCYNSPAASDSLEGSYYTIVNIKRNNGLGAVTSLRNPITQNARIARSLNATRHANGRDWWVIVRRCHTDEYLPILLDPSGVHPLGWQDGILPPYSPFNYNNFTGSDCFSPDGSMFAVNNMSAIGNCITLYDFDRCTGRMRNPRLHNWNDSTYAAAGIAFSETSKYLYINSSKYIFQCDVSTTNPFAQIDTVAADDGISGPPIFQNPTNGTFGLSQLASNGKIYNVPFGVGKVYHVINNPNETAVNTDFQQRGVVLLTGNLGSIPNMPYFCLGPLDGSLCDTLGIDNVATQESPPSGNLGSVSVFPNPTTNIINIQTNATTPLQYKLYDILGREIQSGAISPLREEQGAVFQISLQGLNNGIYFLHFTDKGGKAYRATKVVVQHE
jgi:Secretion system C-terminal sorting domain